MSANYINAFFDASHETIKINFFFSNTKIISENDFMLTLASNINVIENFNILTSKISEYLTYVSKTEVITFLRYLQYPKKHCDNNFIDNYINVLKKIETYPKIKYFLCLHIIEKYSGINDTNYKLLVYFRYIANTLDDADKKNIMCIIFELSHCDDMCMFVDIFNDYYNNITSDNPKIIKNLVNNKNYKIVYKIIKKITDTDINYNKVIREIIDNMCNDDYVKHIKKIYKNPKSRKYIGLCASKIVNSFSYSKFHLKRNNIKFLSFIYDNSKNFYIQTSSICELLHSALLYYDHHTIEYKQICNFIRINNIII